MEKLQFNNSCVRLSVHLMAYPSGSAGFKWSISNSIEKDFGNFSLKRNTACHFSLTIPSQTLLTVLTHTYTNTHTHTHTHTHTNPPLAYTKLGLVWNEKLILLQIRYFHFCPYNIEYVYLTVLPLSPLNVISWVWLWGADNSIDSQPELTSDQTTKITFWLGLYLERTWT